jgi:hypothetical protein
MAGAVSAHLRSCGTGEEERRGWWGSGADGTTRRKEEGRSGFGRATQRRTVWGGGLALVGAHGQRGWAAVVSAREAEDEGGGVRLGGWAVAMGRPTRIVPLLI